MSVGVMDSGGDSVTEKQRKYNGRVTRYVVLTCLMAASGGLMFGYDVGISGGVTSMPSFLSKSFPTILAKINESESGDSNYCKYNSQKLQAFTSSLYIAGLVATFFAGYISRRFGRLITMRLAAFSFIIGTILCASAPNLIMLIIGRILLGCGVGFANQAVPLYLSEMAPANIRGALAILFQLAVTVGNLVANLINYGTNKIDGWGWRLSLGGAGVPAILLAIGALNLFDTPNSLIERGRLEEGKRVLQIVRGVDDVEAEFKDIVVASEMAKLVQHPYKHIIERRSRPQLITAMILQVFQQFTGINAIMFYSPVLFQTLGFGNGASLYSAVVVGGVNVVSTMVAVFAVDKVGRRMLLLEAGVQMFASMACISGMLGAQLPNHGSFPKQSGIGVVVLICVFVSSFAWSWGPLGWLIPSEIFPMEIRSAGQSITVSTNLLFTFLIAQSFLSMLCTMKYAIFLFFLGWIVIMTIYMILFVPETKGIPIEEIQHIWRRHWYWKRFVLEREPLDSEMAAKNDLHLGTLHISGSQV